MVAANYIDKDEQRKWFDSLDDNLVRYFIFSFDAKDVGSANITKINISEKTFEGGVFCGDSNYISHWVNIWACVKMYNYAFFDLKLETSYATILKNNKPALSLNKALGYEFIENTDQNIGRFILTRAKYVIASEKIQRYFGITKTSS